MQSSTDSAASTSPRPCPASLSLPCTLSYRSQTRPRPTICQYTTPTPLGSALLYGYPRSAPWVLGWLYVGSGLGVWLFARQAYHLGASGLAFGMMFFVFTIGALRWDRRAIALSMLVFFLYGGMVWGILPSEPDISYESHFFGALLGVVLAIAYRNNDPAPPRKRYSWEDEADTPFDEPDKASGQEDPGTPAMRGVVPPEYLLHSNAPGTHLRRAPLRNYRGAG